MLKIFLPLLLFGFSLPAFAQTEESSEESTSMEVVWLNSDLYNSISSGFEEFTVGAGYRYEYFGLGGTAMRTEDYSNYRYSTTYTTRTIANAYGFIPFVGGSSLYVTYGYIFEKNIWDNAGAGLHVQIGTSAMVGVGAHTITGIQVFIGAQL